MVPYGKEKEKEKKKKKKKGKKKKKKWEMENGENLKYELGGSWRCQVYGFVLYRYIYK
jgi:hypothetical protein